MTEASERLNWGCLGPMRQYVMIVRHLDSYHCRQIITGLEKLMGRYCLFMNPSVATNKKSKDSVNKKRIRNAINNKQEFYFHYEHQSSCQKGFMGTNAQKRKEHKLIPIGSSDEDIVSVMSGVRK